MAEKPETKERDAKLVQWLNEAHVKEAELEADLTAHISLTNKASYKKRLQLHLKETREHKRRVASRIKKLGGVADSPSVPGVPGAVGEAAGKAIAAVKGQVGAARAVLTEQAETHMRNAQEELREEHVEIAIYSRLETLATAVGDRETAQLAKSIRRDEERMAKFLDAELTRLVKEVVKAEIPRDQRASATRGRRSSRATGGSAASRAAGRASSGRGAGRGSAGRAAARSSSSRASSRAPRATASSSPARSGGRASSGRAS